MNCPQCSQPLDENAKFCPKCGLRTSQVIANANLSADMTPTRIGASTPLPQDSMAGRVIEAKYELISKLGEGGMGTVYRAKRLRIGDEVAVKILHQSFVKEPSALERFRREAQAAAVLNHPNVVGIYDYGEQPELGIPAFIVMELVAGEPLRNILDREGKMHFSRAVALMQSACAGIAAGHRKNIVHRDIKPDNFMVLPPEVEGENEIIKVVDFGIAKLRDLASSASNLTQTGIVMGTPYYMSPEQCKGEHLDPRSDVYSLGVTLYEMLAGSPPFISQTVTGVVAKHLTEPPPPLARDLGVPAALEAVIQRTLAKDPAARQANAAELSKELQKALSPAVINPVPQPEPMPREQTYVIQSPPPVYQPQTQPQNIRTNPPYPYQQTQPPYPLPQPQGSKRGLGLIIVIGVVFLAIAAAGIFFLLNRDKEVKVANTNTYQLGGTQNANSSSNTTNANSAGGAKNQNSSPTGGITPTNMNRNSSSIPGGTSPVEPPPPPQPQDNPPPNSRPSGQGDFAHVEQAILSSERLSADEISGFPKPVLRLLRNTVYAKYGRPFDSQDLQAYFRSKSWYQVNPNYKDSAISATDRANIDLIQKYENAR